MNDNRWFAALPVAVALQACTPAVDQPPGGAAAELLALHAATATPAGPYRLGRAYALEIITPYDEERSLYWFQQAAQAGYAPAQYEIGGHFTLPGTMDYGLAATWFHAAAEQGYPPARAALGMLYAESRTDGSPDPIEAYVWLRLAADGGEEVEPLLHRLVEQLSAEDYALAQRNHRQRVQEY